MHLLPVSSVSLDDGETAVDLAQPPGDIVILSFADSDLSAIAAAHDRTGGTGPSLRLASLKRLRHPLSVDFYIDKTLSRAKAVVVRCLGGLDYWRYGVEAVSACCRQNGIKLAVIPGDGRADARLDAHSTVTDDLRAEIDAHFSAGGVENMAALLGLLGREIGHEGAVVSLQDVPALVGWDDARGIFDPVGDLGGSRSRDASPDQSPDDLANQRPPQTPLTPAKAGVHTEFPDAIADALWIPASAGMSGARGKAPHQSDPEDAGGAPLALVIAYRSAILAGETAPLAALSEALSAEGLEPLILGVTSLKDPRVKDGLAQLIEARRPDVIVSTTAFSARQDAEFVLDRADCPILQATPSGSRQEAWEASDRGLAAADLAMQVALPEFDGRMSGYPISFREEAAEDPALAFARRVQVPYRDGIEALASQAAGWVRLRRKPAAERRVAVVLSDYPARAGRAGFAVGLDTPASSCRILDVLAEAGYATQRDFDGQQLMQLLTAGHADRPHTPAITPSVSASVSAHPCEGGDPGPSSEAPAITTPASAPLSAHSREGGSPGPDNGWLRDTPSIPASAGMSGVGGEAAANTEADPHSPLPPATTGSQSERPGSELAIPLADYRAWLDTLPADRRDALLDRWGEPETDPSCVDGTFRFPVARAGTAIVALQPDRSRGTDRKAIYHDPDEIPTHAYLAFYLALRRGFDAMIHLGTHGTTEWLPGKAVALSPSCWPRLAVGAMPVIYPFIVDDPGEAAPAKRRISGVTIGHLTPLVGEAGLHGEAAALRELVEEFSEAQVLDPRRADLVAADILERAEICGLAAECGVTRDMEMADALTRLDAHLCDLGEINVREGLHVFADAPEGYESCSSGERDGLLTALDGRFVVPGPAGSPSRGRHDVIPTGRNLSTVDPRAIPTRAASHLGEKAAAEVVRRHLQDHGDWPRRVVMDLWASPTLRTGGEDIAHILALMGARPRWDDASTRVTGFEIQPLARLDRPRIDVTVRISGAFRDTFPDQIALIDQAVREIAALDEDVEWNALAEARLAGDEMARIFGAAWGRYGAGVSGQALDGKWEATEDLGAVYLAETGLAFGGRGGDGTAHQGFSARVEAADAFVHTTDVGERDLLDGDSIADSFGGFAAAARKLGADPALYSLDTSNPDRPTSRTLTEDLARIVRGRLTNPRWIDAQLAHGWRGGAELAQGVEALYVFAATTDAVPESAFDAILQAYVLDDEVNARLREANAPAEQAIRDRLADLRRRGIWQSRLNSAALLDEAAE
ncbi:cobaltochelatase subunit CobN [Amorphus orientalis]|uniref:Cobaltochelatase CobN n=1 Tax=Amorphus orientalis TaxID=649198 RepID=A0AAE4AS06_9HYPH|nr:cobaltochelatase subunit CobN [Amorphus orientalis]MDQ0315686.1 cobaltochelatase CobN [Amorphus orientalis]